MTLITPTANIATGGQILAADELTVYNLINGNIDATNITAGSLTGAVFAANTISNTKLKSTSASVGVQQAPALHFGGAYITLPSSTMFFPGLSTDAGAGTRASFGGNVTADGVADFDLANKAGIGRVSANQTPQYIIWLAVLNAANTGTNQAFMTAFYLQASPPYDLGDGEIPLFVFALVGKDGHVVATYVAHDPPWAIPATRPKLKVPDISDEDKFLTSLDEHVANRAALKSLYTRYFAEPTIEGRRELLASIENFKASIWSATPETQEHKNRLMSEIPHPFMHNDLVGGGMYSAIAPLTPVMLDPMDKNMHRLALLHESGENVNTLIHGKHITISEAVVNRKGPPGVTVVSHAFKNSGGR